MPPKKDKTASPAPAVPAAPGTFPQLTESETKLLVAMLIHMPQPRPQPDWNAVATTIGSASGHSASVRASTLTSKLRKAGHWPDGRSSGASPANTPARKAAGTPKTASTTRRSGKRSVKEAFEDEDELQTPTKKKVVKKEELQENTVPEAKVKTEDPDLIPQSQLPMDEGDFLDYGYVGSQSIFGGNGAADYEEGV